jgi:hypothetical protein
MKTKYKSIIFDASEVQSLLAGRKTQFREPANPQPVSPGSAKPRLRVGDIVRVKETFWGKHDIEIGDYGSVYFNGPVLDVSEQFHPGIQYLATPECFNLPTLEFGQTIERFTGEPEPGDWWLSPPDEWDGHDENDHLRRGIWTFLAWGKGNYTRHPAGTLPIWASRRWLEITEVRCQRLMEISDEDCKAEDCAGWYSPCHPDFGETDGRTPSEEYIERWDARHGNKHPSSANPFVFAYSFRVVEKPVLKGSE